MYSSYSEPSLGSIAESSLFRVIREATLVPINRRIVHHGSIHHSEFLFPDVLDRLLIAHENAIFFVPVLSN
jgi:hypothetical protein